jgi:carboxyl-terminal processing protease
MQEAPRDVGSLRPQAMSALILELAAGACASLDEHSSFLTPGHLAGMQAAVRGDLVGVGVDVGVVKDKVQVTRVYAKGPAEGALKPGDVLLKIAGRKVKDLDAEAVAKLLRGKSGQKVEVEYERGNGSLEKVTLIRRAVAITSVEHKRGGRGPGEDRGLLLPDERALGYIKIHHFQASTTQEVKAALAKLTTEAPDPVKGLILDLRGNPGGLFRSAISVAELFLSDAVIVVGQSPFPEYNKSFKSASTNPTQLPVVVLIDGETASAAEVLAGAMKEVRNSPTRVMGQTSYGKGSIQCLIPLEKTALAAPAGIRLTVAKLLSPTSQAYTGRGVTPHDSAKDGEDLVEKARDKIAEMLNPSMGMGMGMGRSSGESSPMGDDPV